MTPCMSLYHWDGDTNNDRKYVNNTIVHTKNEVRSFKRELLPLAVSVPHTTGYRSIAHRE